MDSPSNANIKKLLNLVDAVEPPVDWNGPGIFEGFVKIFPEPIHRILLGSIQMQGRSDRVQILKIIEFKLYLFGPFIFT